MPVSPASSTSDVASDGFEMALDWSGPVGDVSKAALELSTSLEESRLLAADVGLESSLEAEFVAEVELSAESVEAASLDVEEVSLITRKPPASTTEWDGPRVTVTS
jgi:hypothetical protein